MAVSGTGYAESDRAERAAPAQIRPLPPGAALLVIAGLSAGLWVLLMKLAACLV